MKGMIIKLNNNFITEIEIDELRHLKNINIEISKDKAKHLILTGKNGVGKTTILEAIKKYLTCLEEGFASNIEFWTEEISRNEEQLKYEADQQQRILLKNEIDSAKNCIKEYAVYGVKFNLSNEIKQFIELLEQGKLIIAYFDANRQISVEIPKGPEKIDLKKTFSINDNPSKIFVRYLLDLKTQQSFARNEGDMEVANNIEAWFTKLEDALRVILDDNSIKLKFDYRNYDFKLVQDSKEPYGLNELSSGYSSIINIVSDLILRMDKNRAVEERNYVFDTEGIVVIDEIETHLHIELQKKILPFLTSFFPNIQFIVSTHSPFVLNSIDDTVIYDLEKNIRVEDLSAYSYEGIVEGYFEVDNYSNEIKEKIVEYKKLAFAENLSDDEKARRAELRIELKNSSNDLAKELKTEFEEIERKRKKK